MSLAYRLKNREEIKDLLKKALLENKLDSVLGIYENNDGLLPNLALTKNIDDIDKVIVFSPVMPVQASRVISNIKFTENNLKIACLIKPCEMRAVVDLVKLKQIVPDNLLFISMDCPGVYELVDYKDEILKGIDVSEEITKKLDDFEDISSKRFACSICDKFIPKISDIRIRSFGKEVFLEGVSEKGVDFLRNINVELKEENFSSYDEKIRKIIEMRGSLRSQERERFKKEVNNYNAFIKELDGCIRCHNCMVNCPMDYCKECVFRSPVFDNPSDSYNIWLERKGKVRLPADTLIFHLTRLNHMSTSCVSCGMCESSCPSKIRLTRIFAFIGEETQKIFDYESGRSFTEELPVSVFREKELDKI